MQASEDRNTQIAAQVRLVGSNIELQLHRTRESQELRKAFSRLERYRRENARMKDMMAQILTENQRMQRRLREMEGREQERVDCEKDLACASALLQLHGA
jgi:predicted nuclease with TOPRIM domain